MIPRPARPLRAMVLSLALLAAGAHCALAAEPARPYRMQDDPRVATLKRDLLWKGMRAERRERMERAREQARLTRLGAKRRAGVKAKPEIKDEDLRAGRSTPRPALAAAAAAVQSTAANVLVNNKAGDAATSGQAEESIAMLGGLGLAAWNDGQGFVSGGDTQRAAWTADGGATWNTISIPHPPGAQAQYWTSDPVVTVNEKTGKFYYCGLTAPAATTNGVSIVGGHFSGSAFVWDTAFVVRSGPNSSIFFDKQWMVADSSSGNLYLSYTVFGLSGDTIVFQRSTNGGVNWDTPIKLNTTGYGFVQASRPVVGPTGDLYVVWLEIGSSFDNLRHRKSTNKGVSFAGQSTITTFYPNYGTGAPGFNRERGINFPAVAIDRSLGPNRGRIHAIWSESLNYFDDAIGTAPPKTEVENNNFFASATPFPMGAQVRGSLSTGDFDHFSFTATQGTSYIFFCDSLRTLLNYTMRVYCSDTLTRLSYSGDPDPAFSSGGQGTIVWTAPSSGTYYLRMAQTGSSGGYHIWTGAAFQGAERGRDQRDVFTSSSDNGTSWTTPVRVNDDAALHDNWLPEIGVSGEGYDYAIWYDWRDAPTACAGRSHIYAARSTDGGANWSASVSVSDTITAWTPTLSNIQPNQGDYNALYTGRVAAISWADGRRGDADVFSTRLDLFGAVSCQPDSEWAIGHDHQVAIQFTQPNVAFANSYAWTLTGQRNWPGLPAAGSTGALLAGNHVVNVPVSVPDSAAVGWTSFCFRLKQPNGVAIDSCCVDVLLLPVAGVGPRASGGGLSLRGVWPNPASRHLTVSFTLPRSGPASIELVDLAGRRVAWRDLGGYGAGTHSIDLSREAAGLRPGLYAVRLVQGSRAVTSKVSIVR